VPHGHVQVKRLGIGADDVLVARLARGDEGHEAYGARAEYHEGILLSHGDAVHGMHGDGEGLDERADFIADAVVQFVERLGGSVENFHEGSDPRRRPGRFLGGAQVGEVLAAEFALPAADVRLHGDAVADPKAGYIFADFYDIARDLVPQDRRGFAKGVGAPEQVQVRPADPRRAHPDQDLAVPRPRLGDFPDFYFACFCDKCGFHTYPPSVRLPSPGRPRRFRFIVPDFTALGYLGMRMIVTQQSCEKPRR